MTLDAMESVSPDKLGGTIAVFSASDNNGVDDTDVYDTDGVPEDEELGGTAPVNWDPAVDDEHFATAVLDCCSEKFIRLVLLLFKQCAPSRFIQRIHVGTQFRRVNLIAV
jgi:hypothetical protein